MYILGLCRTEVIIFLSQLEYFCYLFKKLPRCCKFKAWNVTMAAISLRFVNDRYNTMILRIQQTLGLRKTAAPLTDSGVD